MSGLSSPPADLRATLGAARTVAEAADATVAHLTGLGFAFPSLYLEQGGRLRLAAQRGYWQVLDGIPTDVGMVGRCYRSGRTVEVADARQEDQFLFAAPDLQREISVPLRHAGRVAGVLNLEARARFPDDARAVLEQVGEAFEERLTELGGPPPESSAQRVARLASAVTALEHEPDVHAAVLDAAIQVSGLPTAALIEPDPPHRARVLTASGPLADALTAVDPADLGHLDALVVSGISLYAHGTETSDLAMHGRLRAAGVAALGVVPLAASGDHLGSLLVASSVAQTLDASVVPSLEILGAQAAASIRAVRTLEQLRRRARQDPLTGLGHHATFQEVLAARCAERRGGRGVAVLLLDVDGFKRVNDRFGHQEGDRVLRELSAILASALRADDQLFRVGGDEFATVLEVGAAEEAEQVARRAVSAARDGPATVSVGVAVRLPGEATDRLVARADRAMYVAKHAGGDAVAVAPSVAEEGR
ncbi:sensor domain-containing diguanylate cyclase [Nitriliruptor alkaliphilus]|uniref:sensor domain-containing diguanylate cyclase n=1 Tax=Nitriliruptor alkaliphilus TaxID=427918 RepID=UPI000696FFEF|nr:sensor domain-containing diguanylate cyclase [Nitriliruptor alkaliphilus]